MNCNNFSMSQISINYYQNELCKTVIINKFVSEINTQIVRDYLFKISTKFMLTIYISPQKGYPFIHVRTDLYLNYFNYLMTIEQSVVKYLNNSKRLKRSCTHYSNNSPFNSTSYTYCKRRCVIYYYGLKYNCTLAYNGILTEFELYPIYHSICSEFDTNQINTIYAVYNKCLNYCPNDCEIYNIYYKWIDSYMKQNFSYYSKFETLIKWETGIPFISYIETPIMTFNDYICYIGGLFGIYFGISIKQIYQYIEHWIITNYELVFNLFIEIISYLYTLLLFFVNKFIQCINKCLLYFVNSILMLFVIIYSYIFNKLSNK